MLLRLEFPEHEVDLAVEQSQILFISFDEGETNTNAGTMVPVWFTTIQFVTGQSVTVKSKYWRDQLKIKKLHGEILNTAFPKPTLDVRPAIRSLTK